jgi:hypothetical protein
MNNPLRILQTLDRHLARPTEITLFGRAALALGFAGGPTRFATTRDVDAILPLSWLEAEDQNLDFWEAQQRTNTELESEGLYITHLFREFEIILRPNWPTYRVGIELLLSKLTVWRPAVLDLVLTKMARGDENDMDDIRFLLQQDQIPVHDLQTAFAQARVPDVAEIRELFRAAQPKVLALANGRRL